MDSQIAAVIPTRFSAALPNTFFSAAASEARKRGISFENLPCDLISKLLAPSSSYSDHLRSDTFVILTGDQMTANNSTQDAALSNLAQPAPASSAPAVPQTVTITGPAATLLGVLAAVLIAMFGLVLSYANSIAGDVHKFSADSQRFQSDVIERLGALRTDLAKSIGDTRTDIVKAVGDLDKTIAVTNTKLDVLGSKVDATNTKFDSAISRLPPAFR